MKLCCLFLFVLLVSSCRPEAKYSFGSAISTETELIHSGKTIFEQKCGHCHNFTQEAIGPNLSGLTRRVETEWIKQFIKSPFQMVAENDTRAKRLHKAYQIYMPGFKNLSEVELDALLSYMHTYSEQKAEDSNTLDIIEDPIKDTLYYSDLVADLEFVAQAPPTTEKSILARINKLDCAGNSGRLLINDLEGFLYELRDGKVEPYLALPDYNPDFVKEPGFGTGFSSFAFHPNFQENGLFYTAHSELRSKQPADFSFPDSISSKLQWVLKEWKAKNPSEKSFRGSTRELLRVDFFSFIHGIQEIGFNTAAAKNKTDYGMLYVGVGDGGSVVGGHPKIALHKGARIWGSILRIDPMGNNSENGKYGIPPDNPFVEMADKRNEIFAYGFRNPTRFSWGLNGALFVSDIGHKIMEEVNLIVSGGFYGWPIREGEFVLDPFGNQSQAFALPENDSDYGATYPVFQYDRDDGVAISGGFFSRGKIFQGKYIFGDIAKGTLYIGDLSEKKKRNIKKLKISLDGKLTTMAELTKSSRVDLRFGQGCDGSIYLLTKADGKIYKIKEN